MAVHRPSVQWALDTNFIRNLAASQELAGATRELAVEKGIRLFITSVVLKELSFLSQGQDTAAELAMIAFEQLRDVWNIEPLALTDSDQMIAENFAEACLRKELLPISEKKDVLILGEASVRGIAFVISSDRHLLSIETADLAPVFLSEGLPLVSVLHPFQVRRSLEGKF